MAVQQRLELPPPRSVLGYDPPHRCEHLRCGLDRFVCKWVPSLLPDDIQFGLIPLTVEVDHVTSGVPHHRHLDQQLLAIPLQLVFTDVAFDLGILREPAVHRVLPAELRDVLVPAVGDEHRRVVRPRITRGGAQENPRVRLSDLVEVLHPSARPHQPLLIKDEELVLAIDIVTDLVPALYLNPVHGYTRERGFVLPVPGVPLLRSRDDYNIFAGLLQESVSQRSDGLTRTDIAPQNTAVVHLLHSFRLMFMQFDFQAFPINALRTATAG